MCKIRKIKLMGSQSINKVILKLNCLNWFNKTSFSVSIDILAKIGIAFNIFI